MTIRRTLAVGGILIALLAGIWLMWRENPGALSADSSPNLLSHAPQAKLSPLPPKAKKAADAPARKTSGPALSEADKNKEIDREHLQKLRNGIFAYKTKYGRYPEYLSQLAPEFVDAAVLQSPQNRTPFSDVILDSDHPDPGVKKPAYGYEFSNLEFRDGRTFAEIKEVQRSEWGDVVPLLRVFGYDKVINMAWGGEIYETQLNWEWDAATLDVVDKLGWGPGLTSGDTVKVRVQSADGKPVRGAKVWADGRNYSFDLPDRPFLTDADGYARIPIGVDHDRTALALRLEASGYTAPLARFPQGQPPADAVITADPLNQTVGGTLVDASGSPVANTRLLLRQGAGDNQSGATLAQVRTDDFGRWQATLHPQEAAAFTATVAIPGGMPLKFAGGVKVDAAAAAAGNATVTAPAQVPILGQ